MRLEPLSAVGKTAAAAHSPYNEWIAVILKFTNCISLNS